MDFRTNELTIRQGKLDKGLTVQHDVDVKPLSTRVITLNGSVPKALRNKQVILRAIGVGKSLLPPRFMVKMKVQRCQVLLLNDTTGHFI